MNVNIAKEIDIYYLETKVGRNRDNLYPVTKYKIEKEGFVENC